MATMRPSSLEADGAAPSFLPDAAPTGEEGVIEELIHRSYLSNAALMRGDVDVYSRLAPLAGDFTLMSPFGGTPSRGAEYTPERMAALGRFFRDGTLRLEKVEAYGSRDLVVLALIEHAHVEVGGLPKQGWSLRVTLVYRREGDDWHLVHRHADPLAEGIGLRQAAALARGEREDAEVT